MEVAPERIDEMGVVFERYLVSSGLSIAKRRGPYETTTASTIAKPSPQWNERTLGVELKSYQLEMTIVSNSYLAKDQEPEDR
jgi:hypothetical protein